MNKVKNILMVIYIFFVLFSLPILPINMTHILGFIANIMLLIKFSHYRNSRYINKNIIKIYVFLFLLLFFNIITALLNVYSVNILSLFSDITHLIINVLPISIYIAWFLRENNKTQRDLFSYIVFACSIQAVLSIISFLSPNIQSTFVNLMISSGFDELLITLSKNRIYGLSTGLTFAMPVLMSFVSVLSLKMSIHYKKRKFLLLFPMIAFSAIINARVSLIIIPIGILLVLFKVKFMKLIPTVILVSLLVFLGYSLLGPESINMNWITDGVNEIKDLVLSGEATGTFDYLLSIEQWRLPSGINLIFGNGYRVMTMNVSGYMSDIGYINDVWFGGMIYIILITSFFMFLVIKIFSKNEINVFFVIFSILTLFITNIKGFIFSFNNFAVLIIIVSVFNIMVKERTLNNEKNIIHRG